MAGIRIGVSRWEDIAGERIERYWERLLEQGLDPVDLNAEDNPGGGWRGLVLTGGIDIDPARYGSERHERVRRTDPARDEFELALLERALREDLPVLAICRGHQLLNVSFGGRLLQHIESGEHAADYRTEGDPSRSHTVAVETGTRLAAISGPGELLVNSRHHQAVTPATLGKDLRISAVSPDGLIEAVESTRHTWVTGVQWHPERDEPQLAGFAASGRALFAAFGAAVRGSNP